MRIAIVGAGTVGTALAVAWTTAGHTITAVTGRRATEMRVTHWLPGVPVVDVAAAAEGADVIAIAVPDDHIAGVARTVADAIEPGAWALHVSGAAGLAPLRPIEAAGGRVLALHPLQTFADIAGALEALPGSTVAITSDDDEGSVLGERLALDLGGRPFRLRDDARPLYHAAAVFGSNDLVAVSGAAAELFAASGVPDPIAAMAPLQTATLTNVHRWGPRAALTGPVVRGDGQTIEQNLRAIADAAPRLVAPYVALCRVALDTAGDRLSAEARRTVEEVLDRWS